ncbi:superoxide dismutase family protein [Streptomyces gobiensis]|uniref:superoxide dismutase family protein n=1 Tax=Streptomyces gobiensis TaxID=2875706 RepID=UPI001E2B20F2|nr:superoxide dismutase family protein [Streptomyces gobiensis]UGY91160.1 superoxide dismutase family protein [Streptomyces gobiensis]
MVTGLATGLATAAMATVLAAVPATATAAGGAGDSYWMRATGVFAHPGQHMAPDAVTYDGAVIPPGSSVAVAQRIKGNRTSVEMHVEGIEPERSYGAHVHTEPCGVDPEDSGHHYQHRVDPVQPSRDPRFANPRNEVWLDFETDAHGSGGAVAHQKWTFRKGEARSVVIHEHPTRTGPGEAGEAGARLACFSVPFDMGR